jgi:hypothetical protein
MEENQSAGIQGSFNNQQPPKRGAKIGLWIALGLALIAVTMGAVLLSNKGNTPSSESNTASNSSAATKLYDALGNAAKSQKLRVAMYRETYANKADADAKQNVGSIASSVSEVDAVAGKYRSVFAHNLLQQDKTFSVGRCMDGDTYNEAYNTQLNKEPRATSLKEIAPHLELAPKGHVYKVTLALSNIPCPHLGILPSSPPLAVARLSDGVFPVTFNDQQAANWVAQVKKANLFDVKDEGMVKRDGKSLRKISFSPKNNSYKVNQNLYDIFYQTGEIEKIKTEHPDGEWQYEFLSINPVNSGGVGGFYLIDEAANMPVYSELYGTNPDKQIDASPAAGRNIARTKQTYAYPGTPTIDINTPLEFLE